MNRQEEKQRRAGRWAVKRLRRKWRKIECFERDRERLRAYWEKRGLLRFYHGTSLPWPPQAKGPKP